MTMTSYREAVPQAEQHRKPCHDCPWRRVSLSGWLGSFTPGEWLAMAHGEAVIECHTTTSGHQCAGAATYRANVVKKPRYPGILQLPPDPVNVFTTPFEFSEHHENHDRTNS